jgi:hypothetical protein
VTVTRDVMVEITVSATIDSEITDVGGEMDRQLQTFERTEHGYPFSTTGAAVHRLVGVVCFVVMVVCLAHVVLGGFVVVVGGWLPVAGTFLGARDPDAEHTLTVLLVLCSC